jgi:multiple sugar transport system permease protein
MKKKTVALFTSEKFIYKLPANVVLMFLVFVPTIIVIWLSVINFAPTQGVSLNDASFIGPGNYIDILTDQAFLAALLRTVIITAVCVVVELFLSLLISFLLSGKIAGKSILFPLLIIPLMIAPVVVGNNFWLLFSTNGPMNQIISAFAQSQVQINWFTDAHYAMIPITLAEIWHWFPLTFLIIYSGLAGVSTSETRAASILGANEWQIFKDIKLPKMKKILMIAIVIRSMEAIKVFDTVHLLTQGGPGTATETISYFLYKNGFWYSRISFISAGAWIVLLICMIIFSTSLNSVLFKEKKI